MRPTGAIARVLERQREWARRRGVSVDGKDRTARLEDNLFAPLHDETRKNYGEGAGNELEGDIRSLRSSAALVCNVFDYWRGRPSAPIVRACGAASGDARISFEATFPIWLGRTPPHLDVILEASGEPLTAIESKFLEIYQPHEDSFRPSYFETPGLWDGLPRSQGLSARIRDGEVHFEHLGAAQLLKHALGLTRTLGSRSFRLLYLWYEVPGDAAKVHREEISAFVDAIGDDFEFRALTYQALFARLREEARGHDAYLSYLTDRYFGP